jgi:copper homeostasis protein
VLYNRIIEPNLQEMYIKEACIESLIEAINAQKFGADILEVCIDLHEDGLSPPVDMIQEIQHNIDLPIKVMVRSRPGDFIYNDEEIDAMINYIAQLKKINVAGYVFGALNKDSSLDIGAISKIAAFAQKPITIHKCIDQTKNPLKEINRLKSIPYVDSILTSGNESTAEEGIPMLRKMLSICGDELNVIVAGKVTAENLTFLHSELGAKYYHGRRIVGQL